MAGFGFNNVGFMGALAYAASGFVPPPAGSRVYCLNDYTSSDYAA